MLEKEKFLAIKKLARDIREDNSKLFKTLSKESVDKAVKGKDDFIKSVIEKMDIHFSNGEEGKEEEQIFRANILILLMMRSFMKVTLKTKIFVIL